MKRKTYLKRLAGILMIMSMFFGTLLVLTSCETTIEPVKPDCEVYDYGNFIVLNTTGYTAWVDVDNIDERRLYHGGQTTYSEVPAGSHKMYIDINNEGWQYKNQYLDECETITYTWYLANKKSTGNLRLDISIDGEILETVTEFEKSDR
jgi:hypothetical protein